MGTLLLLKYARDNNIKQIKDLLLTDKSVDLNATSDQDNGAAAIHYAVMYSNLELIKLLLDFGADVNLCAANDEQHTALHLSAMTQTSNKLELMKLLVEKGADIEKEDSSGWTPLMMSVFYNKADSVKFLTQMKANCRHKGKDSKTALHMCTKSKEMESVEIAEILCEADPGVVDQVDENGRTPLHLAALYNNKVMCDLLLDYGSHCLVAKDKSGKTPIDLARSYKFTDLVEFLETKLIQTQSMNRLIRLQLKPLQQEIQKLTLENQQLKEELMKLKNKMIG